MSVLVNTGGRRTMAVVSLVLFVSIFPAHVTMCPTVCTCWETSNSVSCSGKSLTAVPRDLPVNTISLSLVSNSISSLPANAFTNLTRLQEVHLRSNLLETWSPHVFTGIPLRILSVSENKIKVLHSEMFAQLTNLTDLFLSYNQIKRFQNGVFRELTSLESLFLVANKIQTLPDGAFTGMDNLWKLTLSSNYIRSISAGAFSGLPSLAELDLGDNKISQLPETAFFDNSLLVTLILERNCISSLPTGIFSRSSQLFRLDLEHNNLTSLPPDIFKGLRLSGIGIVNLGSNPWVCDCRIQGLVRWIKNSSLGDRNLGSPTCATPTHSQGVGLREMLSCQHGTCLEEPDGDVCVCDRGWTGLYCQEEQSTAAISERDTVTPVFTPIMELRQSQSSSHTSIETIAVTTSVGIALMLVVAAAVLMVFVRRRKRRRVEHPISMAVLSPFDEDAHSSGPHEAPPVPPRPKFPGLEVDPSRVTLGDKIGRGAFGVVFRAVLAQGDDTEDVVVKTVKGNACEDDKLSFLEEIRAVVDLGAHQNLLGLVGCCTVEGDQLYLITEFMPYGDLKNFLRKCREEENPGGSPDDIYDFQVLQMYQVARQIARGMDHISGSRYVHGDLAARNVLVGADLVVKISDFGLAEDIYSRGYRRQDRLKKVPWKWMAPERLQDGAVYTTQSDVWSFGIVLYEIATRGGDPYPDVPSAQLKDRLQAGYRMPKPEDCPKAMYDVMSQCWSLRPGERPSFRVLELILDKQLSTYGPDYAQTAPSAQKSRQARRNNSR